MVNHKVIDNFLSKSYYKSISELLSGPDFEWWYNNNISYQSSSTHFKEYGFSHIFWDIDNGPVNRFSPFLQPLLHQILDVTNCDFIFRARADMVTWSKEDYIHQPHIDFPFPNTASVFYINETDGDTIFYNVKPEDVSKDEKAFEDLKEYDRVSPSPNRLVIFDGDLLHTGCSPTNHANRILINSNYVKKEYVEPITNGSGRYQGYKIIDKVGQENREAMDNALYS